MGVQSCSSRLQMAGALEEAKIRPESSFQSLGSRRERLDVAMVEG